MTPESLMDAARELARLCGSIALRHFRSSIAVDSKSDGSPVTIADRDAETAAREWIRRRFPSDGILGEEHGIERADARRRWILDPIDGTRTFVRGVPLFGSLVAVLDGDDVVAGAASYPALGETVWAAPGEGCWTERGRAAVSHVDRIESALLCTTDERFAGDQPRGERWRALSRSAGMVRSWGDCYAYLLVATGRAEVAVDPVMNAWDAACFLPIIEEAGGVLTDWSGRRTIFGGSTIATNQALAGTVRDALAIDPAMNAHPS